MPERAVRGSEESGLRGHSSLPPALAHDVFRHYTQLAGIDFKNPEEPLIAAAGPEAADVENLAEYAWV